MTRMKIYVEVSGGCVTAVYSDTVSLDVTIIDYDVENIEAEYVIGSKRDAADVNIFQQEPLAFPEISTKIHTCESCGDHFFDDLFAPFCCQVCHDAEALNLEHQRLESHQSRYL